MCKICGDCTENSPEHVAEIMGAGTNDIQS